MTPIRWPMWKTQEFGMSFYEYSGFQFMRMKIKGIDHPK